VDLQYYGVVEDGVTPTADSVKAMSSRLGGSRNFGWTNINLVNQRTCFAYPSYFGDMSSIKDGNNFEYIDSYTKTQVTINNILYFVYTLTKPTTITGFKQTFS
jgi:hypothetical protein